MNIGDPKIIARIKEERYLKEMEDKLESILATNECSDCGGELTIVSKEKCGIVELDCERTHEREECSCCNRGYECYSRLYVDISEEEARIIDYKEAEARYKVDKSSIPRLFE